MLSDACSIFFGRLVFEREEYFECSFDTYSITLPAAENGFKQSLARGYEAVIHSA